MDILEKIRKVEALIERSGTEGEKQSAIRARDRLLKSKSEEELEYTIHIQDMWHKKLFLAICHKHALKPYRYHRQKYTTAMVRISKSFLDTIVWPEYLRFAKILEELVDEITAEIISKIHKDESETVIEGELSGPSNNQGGLP